MHNPQPAPAKAHHRVGLVQCLNLALEHVRRDEVGRLDVLRCKALTKGVEGWSRLGQKLVQGRVEQANGHGHAVHGGEDALKVGALKGLELGQGGHLHLWHVELLGGNHAAHGGDALGAAEKHVLRAAQAQALGAVFDRHLRGNDVIHASTTGLAPWRPPACRRWPAP